MMSDSRPAAGFAPSAVVLPGKQQLSTSLAGESVVLDTASGRYFTLDHVGALIWNRIVDGPAVTVAELEVRGAEGW